MVPEGRFHRSKISRYVGMHHTASSIEAREFAESGASLGNIQDHLSKVIMMVCLFAFSLSLTSVYGRCSLKQLYKWPHCIHEETEARRGSLLSCSSIECPHDNPFNSILFYVFVYRST